MIDNWALLAFVFYFLGYAGQASTMLRDKGQFAEWGKWCFALALLWPIAALAEIFTKMED